MKTIVTGGAGFIGSHLVEELIANGIIVHIVDNLSIGSVENVHPQAILHDIDICNPEVVELIGSIKPELVFHLAAQADIQRSIKEPNIDANINIIGTINVLEGCKRGEIVKIIYSSSSAVYGSFLTDKASELDPVAPVSYYGISKLVPEMYLDLYRQKYGISYTVLRYANVYGPRQTPRGDGGVIANFMDNIKKKEPLTIFGDGNQSRDFIYVKDVIKANLAAISAGNAEIINISTAVQTSINKLVSILKEIHGSDLEVVYKGERLGEIRHSCLSNSKAWDCLNWCPQFNIVNGINETYLKILGC